MIVTLHMLACSVPGTHNYYLFSTVGRMEWGSKVRTMMMENWRSYSGKQDLYWFDADELSKVAQQKGDVLMLEYIRQLQKYLDVVDKMRETWEYPTKKDLLDRQQTLRAIQKYAYSKTKTRLRSQHALLYMRCNMLLGLHQTNVLFWEQQASKYINSVYRDMMRNIYAGALLKTGRSDEATQIYMEQGDLESLFTYYYKKRSLQSIQAEYRHDPNAAALPFLVQDFANNAQETLDEINNEYNWPGKLYVRNIKQQEAAGMCDFAREVLKEGKTQSPAMWKSLEAWMQYLYGDKNAALKSVREAVNMEGQPRVKDNARVLRLYIETAMTKPSSKLDSFLATELTWLEGKMREERGNDSYYENHYTQVYDRLVHQLLVANYDAAERRDVATAFLAVNDDQQLLFYKTQRRQAGRDEWNPDYSTHFFSHIDKMPVEQLVAYKNYVNRTPSNALDCWLMAHVRHDNEFLNEIIGTKYLRLGQWTEAEKYLSEVSIGFVNTMNIVPFMARRDYRVEPWKKRQRIKDELQYPGTATVNSSQKLEFVREMSTMEQGFGALNSDEKARRAYDLAVRYTQASYAGDAWYLTRYGKSIGDSARIDELNMLQKASELLDVATSLSGFNWEEQVCYAQAWLPLDPWYTEEWSDEKVDFVMILRPQSRQYKALHNLYRLEQRNSGQVSSYVSRCDVLRQFIKAQNKR